MLGSTLKNIKTWGVTMKLHFFASLLAALAVATLVATPAAAAVKGAMKANSGYCRSGKLVGDTKVCRKMGTKSKVRLPPLGSV